MTKLSTAQYRTLLAARAATDDGRGITPPAGPASRPFKFLKSAELLEVRASDLPHVLWLTDKGREALASVEGGKA